MMMKNAAATLAAGMMLVPLGAASASAVPAAAPSAVKAYSSCTALSKDYPAGVRRNSAAVNRHARQLDRPLSKRAVVDRKKRPVSAAVYSRNQRLDFDRDGIACER